MKKKKILITILIVILVGAAIGGYSYYKYNYIDEVTEYYYITYTPPIEKIEYTQQIKLPALMSAFEQNELTDPEVEVGKLQQYANDSIAINDQTKKYQTLRKEDEKKLEYYLSLNPKPNDFAKLAEKEAEVEAFRKFLAQEHYIISFSHHRNYKPEQFFSFIKKNGINWQKMKEFCNKNDLKGSYYKIP